MKKAAKLTKLELNKIKQELAAEKKRFETEIAKIAKKSVKGEGDYETNFVDIGTDESESVSEVEQYSLDLSLEATLEKALRDVTKALESIKKGNYGICKYCKEPIDAKRLIARPTSTSCVACKTRLKSL